MMNIHIPLPERAETRRKIIGDVLAAYGMHEKEFFNRKNRSHAACEARYDAILLLVQAGFSKVQTARILKIDSSCVHHYLHPEYRQKKKTRMRAELAHEKLPLHVKDAVAEMAAADGVGLFSMLAKWIEERAKIEIEQRARASDG